MTRTRSGHDVALALAPVALVALVATWTGTFDGATTAAGATTGHLALLAFATLGARAWRDPLRLGPRGRYLPLALGGAVLLSNLASPVPRAGWIGLLLLPIFLVLPAATARCWSTSARRRVGLAGLNATLIAIAVWALAAWGLTDDPRPAQPLGHHNLLATFVVALAPAAWPALRTPGVSRMLGLGALVLAPTVVIASRSLAATAALAVVTLLGLPRRYRRVGWVILAVSIASQVPRLGRLMTDADVSRLARQAYAEAGLEGIRERPVLGWGPGATPWTSAEHLPARPGVLPAGQIVADLHNLPLQLTYELGLLGFALALTLVGCLIARHGRTRVDDAEVDRGPPRAGWLGLLGLAIASLGGLPWTVTALPVVAAILVGLVTSDQPVTGARAPGTSVVFATALALVTFGLLRLDAGHWAYDHARTRATPSDRHDALGLALRFDPWHPHYRFLHAWTSPADPTAALPRAEGLRAAAEGAHGVAALWLAAGVAGLDTGRPWAEATLERVCLLDPLGPMAPWLLAAAATDDDEASRQRARALAAAPVLLGAAGVPARQRRSAVTGVTAHPGFDADWRRTFAAVAGRRPGDDAPATQALALGIDLDPVSAFAAYAFRRAPWPTRLIEVGIVGDVTAATAIGAASARRDTDPRSFTGDRCTLAN